MTALTGKKPKDTYKDLLQVSNANNGIDNTLRPVEDGEGTASALQLAADRISLAGKALVLDADGDTAIAAASDDRIDFRAGGADRVSLGAGALAVKLAGADDFRFREDALDVLDGSTLSIGSGAVLAVEAGASLSVAAGAAVAGLDAVPAGAIVPYAGAAAPAGWLLCHGQEVPRADYPALFAAIGTAYGAGDGADTFALPDLRGRVAAGRDDMGGRAAGRLSGRAGGVNGAALGAAGGAETHTLSESELAGHSHGAGAYKGSASGNTGSAGSHTHNLSRRSDSGSWYSPSYRLTASGHGGSTQDATASAGAHKHSFSVKLSVTGDSGAAGGGGAHNNVQPTLVLNYLIKT